jgi:branched-chain amino acid transport system substrate-binding protein
MNRKFVLLVLLLLSALLVACVEEATPVPTEAPAVDEPEEPEEAEPTEAAPEEEAEPETEAAGPIRLGVVYPLTGALAATGVASQDAFMLAADIVNNEYPDLNLPMASEAGITCLDGAPVELVFADHQMSPEIGASETERLITEEEVVAILGAYASSVSNTASQAAERLGIPFVNAQSTSPALHQRGFQWYFRTTPHDAVFSELMFQFLSDLRDQGTDINTVATIFENTLFGSDSSETQNQFAEEYGFEVVANIAYPSETADMTSEVQQLIGAEPDVVLPTSYVADAILMMRTFESQNYAPGAILAQGVGFTEGSFLETVGATGNYILSREVFSLDLQENKPIIGQVNDLFSEQYDRDLEGATARSFTALLVLADAINRACSTEPEAIREALLETDIPADQIIMPWQGVRFDPETGQNELGTGIIVQAFDGQYFTVWPFDLATRDLVWPYPSWDER